MKTKINIFAVMLNVCLALFTGTVVNFAIPEFNPLATGAAVFSVGTLPQLFNQPTEFVKGKFAFMALQTEIWIADIQEQLFAGNEFLSFAVDHSAYVNNKTVHAPQAGSIVAVTKNRASLPAAIAQRTDSELTYDLAEFTTDPILITDLDELQTSYEKRQSVTGQQFQSLSERVAKEILFNWTPASTKVLKTTGAATALLPNSTATLTRKKLTKEDVALLATRMDQDEVPADGRYLMLDSIMFGDLFTVSEIMSNSFSRSADQDKGIIADLFGFKIMKRSNVVKFNASGAKVAVGTANAVSDCAGSLAWSKYSVAKAIGQIKPFANENVAEYYGSIFSAMVMAGGSSLRSDNAGIWAIQQERV